MLISEAEWPVTAAGVNHMGNVSSFRARERQMKRALIVTCLLTLLILPGRVRAQWLFVTNNGTITIYGSGTSNVWQNGSVNFYYGIYDVLQIVLSMESSSPIRPCARVNTPLDSMSLLTYLLQ